MSRYSRDPYWLVCRIAGTAADGTPFQKGERVFYYPNTKTILTGAKAEQAARDFEVARADEAFRNGGF